jgi:hypothetical protein
MSSSNNKTETWGITMIRFGAFRLEEFDAGDILVLADDTNGKQYYYNGKTIQCTTAQFESYTSPEVTTAKLKDELFMKMASSYAGSPEQIKLYVDANKAAMESLSLSDDMKTKLEKLNSATDMDTVMLAHNILKRRYNVVFR